jgi:hypothetical protein
MDNIESFIAKAYAAFNERRLDDALALMTEDVDWPKTTESGRAIGKEAVRAYWTRQWSEMDPNVEPLEVTQNAAGQIEVKVRLCVKDLQGNLIAGQNVVQIFTMKNGLIERLDIGEPLS